jgi:hypothetical protein
MYEGRRILRVRRPFALRRARRARSIAGQRAVDGSSRILDRVAGTIRRVIDVLTGARRRSVAPAMVMMVTSGDGQSRGHDYGCRESAAEHVSHGIPPRRNGNTR